VPRGVAPLEPIPSSSFVPLRGARIKGSTPPNQILELTLVVRPRIEPPALHADPAYARQLPRGRSVPPRKEAIHSYSAAAEDFEFATEFVRATDLELVEESPTRRALTVRGSAKLVSSIFGVELLEFSHEHLGDHRGVRGLVHLPAHLVDVIRIIGLNERPAARRHLTQPQPVPTPQRISPPWELMERYRFPQHPDGSGQCIGLLELGGGFHEQDVQQFFQELGVQPPKISVVNVGRENEPADPRIIAEALGKGIATLSPRDRENALATFETTMDIQMAGMFAPGAEIVVYFAPLTERGIFNALMTALTDLRHQSQILSLSWGEAEPLVVSEMYLDLIDDVLRLAAAFGITVCVSSGDWGSANGSEEGGASVNFPASSPYALACGGTAIPHRSGGDVVWSGTFRGSPVGSGGGLSQRFPPPPWQTGLHANKQPLSGRGVPDVAGPADPSCGPQVLVGGIVAPAWGTSAVPPFWAALLARCNQGLACSAGYLNPILYRLAKRAPLFGPVLEGSNGAFCAGAGWNPCAGLGVPRGDTLLAALNGDLGPP